MGLPFGGPIIFYSLARKPIVIADQGNVFCRNLYYIIGNISKKTGYLCFYSEKLCIFAQTIKYNDVMTAITINIPNHEVSFFKKMIAKMGWTYSEADVVRSAATPKEQALAKVDHAFGQLRQMKDGQLQGNNAEDLLNKLGDWSLSQ